MSTAVATSVEQLPIAPAPSESAAILSVIERMALNPEIDPDRIERFIALKERIDASAAKLAFSDAVAKAKAEISKTPIIKNRMGNNEKRYADIHAYASVVDPIINGFGLVYRFKTQQTDNRITVTCVLTGHGHEEEHSLSGPADTTGNKNAIQSIGSTLTYLQRYTLVQALGLAASDDDDGTASGAGETISDAQIAELRDLIEQTGTDIAKFCAAAKINAVPELRASDFPQAKRLLQQKLAKKQGER